MKSPLTRRNWSMAGAAVIFAVHLYGEPGAVISPAPETPFDYSAPKGKNPGKNKGARDTEPRDESTDKPSSNKGPEEKKPALFWEDPVISSLEPSQIQAGGPDFTLIIRGTGFVPNSQILWQLQTLPAQYVSPEELRATVSAALIAQAGTFTIRVVNPLFGGSSSRSFTVTEAPIGGDAGPGVNVGPNPWMAGKQSGGVRFFKVPADSWIEIYTLSGNFVRRVDPVGSEAQWDVADEQGQGVPAGLYLYMVAPPQGGADRRGLLTIVR